jgi:hypothetical protein
LGPLLPSEAEQKAVLKRLGLKGAPDDPWQYVFIDQEPKRQPGVDPLPERTKLLRRLERRPGKVLIALPAVLGVSWQDMLKAARGIFATTSSIVDGDSGDEIVADPNELRAMAMIEAGTEYLASSKTKIMRNAREHSGRRGGRKVWTKEDKARAKPFFFDRTLTQKQAEEAAGIPYLTMYRWWRYELREHRSSIGEPMMTKARLNHRRKSK